MSIPRLRAYAINRSLFAPTTLARAIRKLGFVQADPIRAPARAQDLILRHRVRGYRAGDLERRYPQLEIEEDFFVNHGFLPRPIQVLMHPRGAGANVRGRKAQDLLAFVRERAQVHPREVDAHFAHGSVRNYWGGSSSATTHLLTRMHYGGLLRVVGRDAGIRLYAAHTHGPLPTARDERHARIDALVDVAVALYAPVPSATMAWLVNRLRYAVPQWAGELRQASERAKVRLAHERVDGVDWYWPHGEEPRDVGTDDEVRFLAPFDPIVWDRRRFELFWGWSYRFEAYTPAPRRKLGYYAMPLLWRGGMIGWGNFSVSKGQLESSIGYVAAKPPRDRAFRRALEQEIDRLRVFLVVRGRDTAQLT